jgi:hypothetical protein
MADYDGFAWGADVHHRRPRMMSGNPRLQEVLPQGGRLVRQHSPWWATCGACRKS